MSHFAFAFRTVESLGRTRPPGTRLLTRPKRICSRVVGCGAITKGRIPGLRFGNNFPTMRIQPLRLALVSSFVFAYVALAAEASHSVELLGRDGDEHIHGHGVAPLLELNETDIALRHGVTPPSYYTIDWKDSEHVEARHPGLIIIHAVFMCLAFFVFLPIGITMRSLRHAAHGVAVFGFYASFVLAIAASSVYRKLTPNMYPGSTHANLGYSVFLVALALTFIDTLGAFQRLVTFMRSEKHLTFKGTIHALLGRDGLKEESDLEYIALVGEETDFVQGQKGDPTRHSYDVSASYHIQDSFPKNPESAANHSRTLSGTSDGTVYGCLSPRSEETLHDTHLPPRISLVRRIGSAAFSTIERTLVLAGLGMLLSGIVIYTGGCRQKYINGWAIFWCYGVLSFARYLGWCSEIGWSWNRARSSGYPTAEMVESTVIFLYGATNTWMERFGAKAGILSPQSKFNTLALLFAGLVGIAIESKTVRKWLSALTVDAPETVSEPADYRPSFNPFPALVIGITGSVMAAHAQTYLFQVQIHALWGNLLVAFAVLRCFTYFFLWVTSRRSTLPSRPPSEALGSFFLACGGVTFIFSTEEVTIMAMRQGRDDIMMFAIIAVAITCLAFSWIICILGFHGWLKARTIRAAYRNSK
ncbi:hypothetical protein MSAN_00596800 [Mycena sanguinolenta]|uniref:Uncharacterized protein n=1 Tax=Mycena sanguinolenta TaxID=230812 RepID=A0A8H6ZAW0_9AGAR|nr:hypothetical protein MSAN_00596800 [Mycena sanguinolenta]